MNISTSCIHGPEDKNLKNGGLVTPIFTSSAWDYRQESPTPYPRYFNTPNHNQLADKLARLEKAEAGLVLSSGMAAITTILFGLLQKGDHAVFQGDLYGGTTDAVMHELEKFGINYSFAKGHEISDFEKCLKPETRLIYFESPSNPLLNCVDIKGLVKLARSKKLLTVIDNTFASPVNQNPVAMGVDVVMHSATKYLGGHSDLCAGAILTSKGIMERLHTTAIHFGGSPDAQACYLLDRSIKTLFLRVQQQNQNAMALAQYLEGLKMVKKVYYPGLPSHPHHAIASTQMAGYGGMLSFELEGDLEGFLNQLEIISPAISLGGVESTICSPALTSHARISAAERHAAGIRDNLLRLSVGIEDIEDLKKDIEGAIRI